MAHPWPAPVPRPSWTPEASAQEHIAGAWTRLGTTTAMDHGNRTGAHPPRRHPLRALVVDDEEKIAELLRVALRYEGWDVEVALNGAGRSPPPSANARTRWCST